MRNFRLRLPFWRKPSLQDVAIVTGLGLCIAFIGIIVFLKFGGKASANWFDDNWLYRTAINFGNTGSATTNKKVKVEINTASLISAGKMKSDCTDSRFTDINGSPLSFYQGNNLGTTANMRHESNDFSEYTSSNTDAGDLSISASAAMGGSSYGMAALIDDTNNIYASKTLAFTSPTLRYRFYFDPNSITMVANDFFYLGGIYVSGTNVVNTHLRWTGTTFQLRAAMDNDAGASNNGTYFDITDAPHYIEIEVNRATTVSSNDATLEFYIDGVLKETLSGIDLYNQYNSFSNSRWGAVSSLDAGTSGTIYLDEFAISDNAYTIGPVADACNNASTDYFVLVPSILSGSNSIYHYYGNTNPPINPITSIFDVDTFTPTSGPTVASEQIGPGPVAAWSFDEGRGTTAYDSTLGNNGTVSVATWKDESQCLSGKCLYFDGTSASMSVEVTASNDLKISGAMSASAWVKPNSPPAGIGRMVIGTYDWDAVPANSRGWFIGNTFGSTDNIQTYVFDSSGNNASVTVNNFFANYSNQWTHLEMVYVPSTSLKLYINGELAASDTTSVPASIAYSSVPLRIGLRSDTATQGEWHGYIDESRVYPYARTADQVKQDFLARGSVHGAAAQLGNNPDRSGEILANGLVGHWKMDEASANTCSGGANDSCDSTGNQNDMAWDGSAPAVAMGKFGTGTDFESSNSQFMSRADTTSLSLTSSFTTSAWIKMETVQNSGIITKDSAGSNRSFYMAIQSSKVRFLMSQDGTNVIYRDSQTTLNANTWYHVVGVYNSEDQTLNVYLNGVLDNGTLTGTVPSSVYDGNSTVRIGYGVSNGYFDGIIDDARIYSTALDQPNVTALYNFTPAPVGYWKLDDNTGTSAIDSSTLDNTLTLTNSPLWTQGKFSAGVAFAGSNQHLLRADDADFDFIDDADVTLSTWFKHTTASAQEIILSKYNEAGYKIIMESDGDITCALDYDSTWTPTDSATSTAATYDDNIWHHITCVKSGDRSLALYIDGELIATDTSLTATNTLANSDPLYIGINADGTSNDFTGSLDDIRIYNYARSSGQIVEDMNGSHPIGGSPVGSQMGYWKFDEGYGSTANDTSINVNNGTISGATWTNDGKFGKALNFDGTADNVAIAAVTLDEQFTISHWVKTTSSASQMVTVGNAGSGDGYRFGLNGGRIAFLVGDAGGYTESNCSSGTLNDNQWHYIAGVFDNSKTSVTCYLDGQAQQTITTTDFADMQSTATPGIGAPPCCTDFIGSIDEVKIYSTALTSDQIRVDYNRGKSVVFGSISTGSDGTTPDNSASREYCLPGDTTSCSGPVGEWKFDENTGATLRDTSGNANDGTVTAGKWDPGKFGSSFSLMQNTNVQDFVNIGDPASGVLDFSNAQDYTMSAWYKWSGDEGNFALLRKGATSNADPGYDIFGVSASGIIRCRYTGGAGVGYEQADSVTNLKDNKWHYISCVMDRNGSEVGTTGLHIFVDGVLEGSDTSLTEGTGVNASNLRFGEMSTSQEQDASIDQIRIYNYARTRAQIAWEYSNGAPLVQYRLDDCQGTTAYNSALNGNGSALGMNGTITASSNGNTAVGTCTSATSTHMWSNGATGKINSSLNFDGSDDFVSAAYDSRLSFGANQDFTVAAWVKSSQAAQLNIWPHVVSRDDNNATRTGFNLATANSNATPEWYFQIYVANTLYNNTGRSNIRDGTWHHLVGMRKGATLETYQDGIFVRSVAASTGALDRSIPLRLGGNSAGASPDSWSLFGGSIDDVRIYNYALTPILVKTLYNNGAASFK